MKRIKILLIAAAALFALSSCYEKREFTPATGSTPVEFVSTTVTLASEYTDIPVHQLTESDVYTQVSLEVLGCTALHLNGETITLEDDSDIIFASKELYVAPLGEEGDGSSSFEVRIPGYADYQRVDINVRLTGPSTDIETTITLQGVERYEMAGLWNLDSYGQVLIEEDEEDYTRFYVSVPLATGQIFTYPATRAVNTLQIDPTYTIEGEDGYNYFMCYAADDASSLSPGSPVEFTFTDDNTFSSTGIFLGLENGGKYYTGTSLVKGFITGAGTGTRVE